LRHHRHRYLYFFTNIGGAKNLLSDNDVSIHILLIWKLTHSELFTERADGVEKFPRFLYWLLMIFDDLSFQIEFFFERKEWGIDFFWKANSPESKRRFLSFSNYFKFFFFWIILNRLPTHNSFKFVDYTYERIVPWKLLQTERF
jgi:hypothetical protein